jgi:hypothetical protein
MADTTFEQDGVTYEVVYAAKRVDMLEAALGNRSVVSVFAETPTVCDARTLVAYGLREVGSTSWVNPSKALEVIGSRIESSGLSSLMEMAATAIMRDCGFLFQ